MMQAPAIGPNQASRARGAVRGGIGLRHVCWLGRPGEVSAKPYMDLSHCTDGASLYKLHYATVISFRRESAFPFV